MTPLGDLVAEPGRGLVYGNRGCLHDEHGRIRRSYAGKRWIACRLSFRGWHRSTLLQPGRFTELFFLDEATAFAAGHRPCALCRFAEYRAFTDLWSSLHPEDKGADAIDATLHTERLDGARGRRLHRAPFAALPDGTFVLDGGASKVIHEGALLAWSADGYGPPETLPRGEAEVITPLSLVRVLASGWRSELPLLKLGEAA